ncbi:MAG: DNA polymerase I [Gemmatimonadaceae bacterium]|nr:DNA polymerase I [Gemmatimonadaceae bacterium]
MPATAVTDALPFREIVLFDFEFSVLDGEPPRPRCLVAREMRSGRELRVWEDQLRAGAAPPYDVGGDVLVVAYYASAEIGCHLALGWPVPSNVLDLYVEFRLATNGLETPCGAGLRGALIYYGLDVIGASEKDEMRQLALRGGPWTDDERTALLDYCASDVDALARLLPVMLPRIDLPRALLRGRFMGCAAVMEHNGVPVDTTTLITLRERWSTIQERLIERIDSEYGVFEGRTFKLERWAQYLVQHDIPWPRLPSGQLALDDDTFREMARGNAAVAPIRELRHALSQMRLAELAVGVDGRNRTLLSAFRARTGRNQPSNTRFIFGPSTWLRSLISPPVGHGLAYVDWSQQEFGIAAALSQDAAMMTAYSTGDPYLEFARQARAVPPDATKTSHGMVRERFKACALATMFGMGPDSFAQRIGSSTAEARALLDAHRRTYPTFWKWSDAAVDHAMLRGWLHTTFGWRISVGKDANHRSLRNFPVQANGAEMLRLACCLAVERGIKVCAPIHDALLVEAPLDQLDEVVVATQAAMAMASEIVLDGFQLRSDVKVVRYPDRYVDPRGERMWTTVLNIVRETDPSSAEVATPAAVCTGATAPVHGRSSGPSSFSSEGDL